MASTRALVDRIRIMTVQIGPRSTLTDDQIIASAVNPTAREVAAEALAASKSVTITLSGGVASYSFPSSVSPFMRAASVTFGSAKKPLTYLDRAEIALVLAAGSGEPRHWSVWDNRFIVAPTPISAETVYLDAYGGPAPCGETTPASSLDELGFPADAEDAVVFGASAIISAVTNEPKRQESNDALYRAKLATIRKRFAPDADNPQSARYADAIDHQFVSFGGF